MCFAFIRQMICSKYKIIIEKLKLVREKIVSR